ncbi:MAG: hypothetical protein NTY50_19375, partial [Methylobacter sp.]|nr:hypothetical protein [Methylobacter sp.]
KLRLDSPFSLREKVRMRGSNKAFFLIFILLTPTLSSRRGSFFLNLMAVTPERGNYKTIKGAQ